MPSPVPLHLARERNRILRDLAAEKKLAFMRGFIGNTIEAITLKQDLMGVGARTTEALTDNYLRLQIAGSHSPNRWMRVQVDDVINGAMIGSVHDAESRDVGR